MRIQIRFVLAAAFAMAGLGLAGSAAAAPITYGFTAGHVDVTGTVGAATLFSETEIPLTGSFVTFDDAVPEVVGFEVTGGPSDPIMLSSAYGGFDGFVLDDFTITPGAGFTNLAAGGGPSSFTFTVGPVDAVGVATPLIGAIPGLPIPFSESSTGLTGTIDISAGTLTLEGITLLVVSVPGEPAPLIVKGDITFTGMTLVPEPGMALLVLLGLAGVSRGGRRFST